MELFETIKADDQEFGNTWATNLRFANGTNDWRDGERPKQFSGVHGLVHLFEDEWHIMGEDDGHFWTEVIISEVEVRKIHESLSKLITNFKFKNNYKVTFDTHIVLNRTITNDISLTIVPRGDTAPIIDMDIKGENVRFDVNWLKGFIEVLDIDNPINS